MNICSRFHDEVCYDGYVSDCPCCELLRTNEELTESLNDAQQKLIELEKKEEGGEE